MSSALKLAILSCASRLAIAKHTPHAEMTFQQEFIKYTKELESKGWLVKDTTGPEYSITPTGETVLNEMLEVLSGHL